MLKLYKYSSNNIKIWAYVMLMIAPFISNFAQKPLRFSGTNSNTNTGYTAVYKDKSSITSKIINLNKKGIFDRKDKFIGYTLRLYNNVREEQTGEISIQVSNNAGKLLYQDVAGFSMRKKGEFEKNYFFDASQLTPGYYTSKLSISSYRYADTLSYTFGFEPSESVTTTSIAAPRDFVNFWDQAKRDLSSTNPDFVVTPRPDLFKRNFTTYEVEYKSIDKAIIYGWLTVPENKSSHPLLYIISDYQSELIPEYRRDLAVLSINTRGTGSSNQNYNLGYDQLGVYNIRDKNRFYLKGVYLDGLRGLDLISQFASQLRIDTRKIVVQGAGLGASVAAYLGAVDSRVSGIVMEGPNFIGLKDNVVNNNSGFPSNMFLNYINQQRVSKDNIINTLDYFDPIYFAPYINNRLLVGYSLNSNNSPAQNVVNFYNQIRVKKDKYECKNCGNTLNKGFYGFKETWLKERFGQP